MLVGHLTYGFSQDVILNTQADVDAFDMNTTIIDGNLLVGSNEMTSDITNLATLTNITMVKGVVIVNFVDGLTNMDGFSSLASVGSLRLSDNANLSNLDGLSNLGFIEEDLRISFNPALLDIEAFSSLESLNGYLNIYGNTNLSNLSGLSNLTSVGGYVTVSSNMNLPNMDDLSNLTFVGGDLNVSSNTSLSNIDGLSNLELLGGDLIMYTNNSLPNLDGLFGLTAIGGGININSNPILSNVDGLSNVTEINGDLQISSNTALANLDGLSSLTTIHGNLSIPDNHALNQIDGLSNLTYIGGNFSLSNENFSNFNGLPSLTFIGGSLSFYQVGLNNLDGFSNLTSIGNNLSISSNHIEDLNGLSSLTSIGGNLLLSNNLFLLQIDGLSNLDTIPGSITITGNNALRNVNGLSNISFIEEALVLGNNSVLTNCCGIRHFLLTEETIGGTVSIYNNPSPCDNGGSVLEDTECESNFRAISGNVFLDLDANCLRSDGDISKSGVIVEATSGNHVFTTVTNGVGDYIIYIIPGTYQIRAYTESFFTQPCEEPYVLDILEEDLGEFPLDIPLEINTFCPYMEVDVSSSALRVCFDNTYNVHYCNNGTAEAIGAYVELELDEVLFITDSSVPFTGPDTNNIYTFDIGDVGIDDCGTFSVNVQLPCEVGNVEEYLGQTLCMDAHIYPDDACVPPSSLWDGSSTEVTGECDSDTVRFKIINKGFGDMLSPRTFYVIEDQVIFYQGEYQLPAGGEMALSYFANGSTFRVEAKQANGHPQNNNPSKTVEACGMSAQISLGFVNQFLQDDASPFASIECREVTGSYDPNDKQAFPVGYGEEHFIEKNTDIEYLIRFQNTGTDTAFTVVVKDEISSLLNLTTISPGASSHPYTFQMTDSLVEFVFNDIMLVDSTTNEEASHGFVKFRISQQPDLPKGTVIENTAGIYFDFNAPIITNTAFHTIGEDFVIMDMVSSTAELFQLTPIKAYPNPFSDVITFELDGAVKEIVLSVYDVTGREVAKESYTSFPFQFSKGNLNDGVYFFKLSSEGLEIASGKIMVE